MQLDQLDYKILNMLSSNARKPYLEVARECGVSGAAIHQRIQKLTQMGVFKGAISVVDPSAVGYDTCAYIGFYLHDASKFDEVVERIKAIPEVVECHFTTGKYDMFIKMYGRNNEDLLRVIHTELSSLGSARTETLISLKEVFHRNIPITTENKTTR